MTQEINGPLLTFHADKDESVAITCPICDYVKRVDAKKFREVKRPLKVRCRCGELFYCRIEYRKHYRKKVMLPGEYQNPKTDERNEILVEDISITGLGFSPLRPHYLQADDVINIKFTLDNKKRSEIKRRARVKVSKDGFVGAEFIDRTSDKDLNFYLMP